MCATYKDVNIEKYREEKRIFKYKIKKSDTISHLDNDVTVIEIPTKHISDFGDVELIRISQVDEFVKQCHFRGYPAYEKNLNERSYLANPDLSNSGSRQHEFKVDSSFMTFYDRAAVPQLVKGFSGSAIFANFGNDLYLVGIISKFKKSGAFICHSFDKFFREKTLIYDFHSECIIPGESLSCLLENTLKQLKPRYSESNFELPIEKKIDALVGNSSRRIFLTQYFNFNFANVERFTLDSEHVLERFLKLSKNMNVIDLDGNVINYRAKIDVLRKEMESILKLCKAYAKDCRDISLVDDLEAIVVSSLQNFKEFNNSIANFRNSADIVKLLRDTESKVLALSHSFDDFRFMNNKVILVKSKAGYGKSQLMGYLAKKWSSNKVPCFLILGQSLSEHAFPWLQIKKQISSDNCGQEDFLSVLEKMGKAAEHPVVIFIDAINEGKGIPLWNQFYTSFVETLQSYNWIKVILSYRTTYEKALFEGITIDPKIVIDHLGFKGREKEAVNFFFQDAGLPVPNLPSYSDNFSNPLFLKLFVIYYKKHQNIVDPKELLGLSKIFKNFFSYINHNLGKNANHPYESEKLDLVGLCIKSFVKSITESNKSYINYMDSYVLIEDTVRVFLEKPGFLNSLISEDLFSESIYWDNDSDYEYGIVFSYQKMGEFLIARHLLEGKSIKELKELRPTKNPIIKYLTEINFAHENLGVLESICLLLPEMHGHEVFDIWPQYKDSLIVITSFLNSLSDRSNKGYNENTVKHLKRVLTETRVESNSIWTNVLTFLFEPGNSFNADFLHTFLYDLSLAERDSTWTIYLQGYIGLDAASEISSILQLGLMIDSNDVKLPSTINTITWFLSSSNRKLRDDATRILIIVMAKNMEKILPWMKKFESVNDPYIRQRLYAIAFGSSFRTKNKELLSPISSYIYETIFNQAEVVSDILLRDYARLTIEYHLFNFPDKSIDIKKIRPPYNSKKIRTYPTDEKINGYPLKLGYQEKSYSGIHMILSSMITEHGKPGNMYGDFGRYVFGNAFKNWKSIDENKLSNLAIKLIVDKYGYNRTLSDLDTNLTSDSRQSQNVERIGKKYQWIAFHEILASVSDQFKFSDRWHIDESKLVFKGPWNPNVRDFDPTCITLSNNIISQALPSDYEYKIPKITNTKWISGKGNIPDARKIISYEDLNGEDWFVLEIDCVWYDNNDSLEAEKSLWYQVRSYITQDSEHSKILKWAKKQNFMGRWLPESTSRTEQYLGEYFWSPSNESFRNEYYSGNLWQELVEERGGKSIGKVSVAALQYLWEKEITGSRSFYVPNEYLFKLLELTPSRKDAMFTNSGDKLVAFDPSFNGEKVSCLVVNKRELLNKLKENHLNIFWTVLGEKQLTEYGDDRQKKYSLPTEISIVVSYKNDKLHKKENILVKDQTKA